MKKPITLFLGAIFIYFVSWYSIYNTNINQFIIQSEDTIPSMFLPFSIIKKGTLYLDDYYQIMIERYPHPDDKKYILGKTPFYLRKVSGHYLSAFPIMSSILALPIYLIPVFLNIDVNWFNIALLARLSSAIIVGLSGVFLYQLLLKLTKEDNAFIITLIYLFATINFASISQALWQHGTLELFTILSLLFLVKAPAKKINLYFSGLFLGLALISRPTAVLFLITLSFYVLKVYKFSGLVKFLAPLIVPIAFFLLYNSIFYESILNQGYSSQLLDSWRTPIFVGFAGLWLSPSKGILVYSPVFLFSLFGSFLVLRKRYTTQPLLYKSFIAIILLHTLVVGMWKHWYGGWSFGYRMASDVIPFLAILLVPYLESGYHQRTKKVFFGLLGLSVLVELLGIAFFDGIWHGVYDKGFKDQRWLWSLKESELVFYVKRVLAKLNVITVSLP